MNEPSLPSSLEEMKREYDKKQKTRNEISAKLGQKMLGGWCLLGSVCPNANCEGTPLMRLKEGPMTCVSCEKEFVLVNDSVVEFLNKENSQQSEKLKISKGSLDLSDAPILNFQFGKADPSSKIAEKLLAGWTLLDECCLSGKCRGSVPLMKSRDGKKHCVECGVVNADNLPIPPERNSDNKADVRTNERSTEGNRSENRANSGAARLNCRRSRIDEEEEGNRKSYPIDDGASASDFDDDGDGDSADTGDLSLDAKIKQATKSAANKAYIRHNENRKRPPPVAADSQVLRRLRWKLLNTVRKLGDSKDVDECIQLSALVKSLAEAIKAVHEVGSVVDL